MYVHVPSTFLKVCTDPFPIYLEDLSWPSTHPSSIFTLHPSHTRNSSFLDSPIWERPSPFGEDDSFLLHLPFYSWELLSLTSLKNPVVKSLVHSFYTLHVLETGSLEWRSFNRILLHYHHHHLIVTIITTISIINNSWIIHGPSTYTRHNT